MSEQALREYLALSYYDLKDPDTISCECVFRVADVPGEAAQYEEWCDFQTEDRGGVETWDHCEDGKPVAIYTYPDRRRIEVLAIMSG